MRKAFTLIELLVVIAIVAILAAILFPVFAQAKAAAKASSGLSSVRQQGLAIVMYAADNDDMNPIAVNWNTGNDQFQFPTSPGDPPLAFATWAWVIQPYIENSDLFIDPLAYPNPAMDGVPQANIDTYYTQFGYNYTWLSPDFGAVPGYQNGTSSTSFGQPSLTVMITSKWAAVENSGPYDWGTAIPGGALAAAVSESPACYNIPMWCIAGWGGGAMSFYDETMQLPPEAGKWTGGVSHRHAGLTTVAWLDGHASRTPPARLAAGTDWTPTASEGVDITDEKKYLWDNK